MELRRISPAPRRVPSTAHSTASTPVLVRPPWVVTSKPLGVRTPSGHRLASIDSTTHCEPNLSAAALSRSGSVSAAVLTLTLSAPARSSRSKSATARTPPPTVSGMNTDSAVLLTTSSIVERSELDAVISRKTSSSAPSRSYRDASSTGSPASRRSVKFTPLTTRPASTSRHGMTRIATVMVGAEPTRTGRAAAPSPRSPPRG